MGFIWSILAINIKDSAIRYHRSFCERRTNLPRRQIPSNAEDYASIRSAIVRIGANIFTAGS